MNTEREFTKTLANLDLLQRRKFVDEMETLTKTGEIKFSTMLSAEDIKFLHKNSGEVASHSHTHSILTNLATDEVDFELSESKRILEEITCEEVNTLAYPNGVFSEEVMERGKKLGYKFFLKTEDKINRINREDLETSFFRVNQYHKSASEALAHIYGITNFIGKII
jgi:peptidoglycan/xylan/chitin deacetylase (PgdA/CDA1 family)